LLSNISHLVQDRELLVDVRCASNPFFFDIMVGQDTPKANSFLNRMLGGGTNG
jgi:hypothetical protein